MQKTKKKKCIAAFFMAFLFVGLALTYPPQGEAQVEEADRSKGVPDILRQDIKEEAKTQILILGTSHLRQIEQQFKPEMLDSLITILSNYNPDVIAVETVTPELIETLKNRLEISPLAGEVLETFAHNHLILGKKAQDHLEISFLQIQQEYKKTMKGLTLKKSRSISSEERARNILIMLAGYDLNTALLQWAYLKAEEKSSRSPIPEELGEILDEIQKKVNEVNVLAVRLSKKLGLQRLYPVDDFEDLDAVEDYLPQLKKEIAENPFFKQTLESPVYKESQARLNAAVQKSDLLPYYRYLNSPQYIDADVKAQWGVFLKTHLPSRADRNRLGLWETRNLKIAAHLRTVCAMHPGKRILVIYGVAHKPFLEAYLNCWIDVRLVKFEDLFD